MTESQQLIKSENKRQLLFIFLCGIFISNAIVAEIIGSKIFSLESFIGVQPAQIEFFGDLILDFNLSAGVVLWPVVFITTDIINEYFGKKGVKVASFLTAGLISYVFFAIFFVTELPPAQFWLDINSKDSTGAPLNIDESFNIIFIQGLGIIIGSLVAFLIGQFIDAHTFQIIRRWTGNKRIWLRATASTLISQLIDSFVVLFIAFYVFGNWPIDQVIAIGIINYIYKFAIAVFLTPLLYVAHYIIDAYLGKEFARHTANNAAKTNLFADDHV
ncbi:queuosine precursor transporter [Flammeovirga sp. MY04]|uniref:queuosine precursor transporter n=1 Tax=Flammeovirga sp. MY04 TaxID=1191459 RepID=UPI000806108C|nr:queuosine precursor transporter [Flammeovirga sp. MY04]ANQ49453.1 queuosine precursor transporter [Flammeovirga sp. MY04]